MHFDKKQIFLCDGGNLGQMADLLESGRHNLEVQYFSRPQVLAGDLQKELKSYKESLAKLPTCRVVTHGPFIDVNVASPDPDLAEISRKRYLQGLDCAVALKAEAVTFHTQYNPMLRLSSYIQEWLLETARFFTKIINDPAYDSLSLYVENMFEDSPDLMAELMKKIDSPRVGITMDVGHVNVYGKGEYLRWIRMLAPYIRHIHLSDNEGMIDQHIPLGAGTVDFDEFFTALGQFNVSPTYTIEMGNREDLKESLEFLESLFPVTGATS